MFSINPKNLVHSVLGHSYMVFFVGLVVGSLGELYFPVHFPNSGLKFIGTLFLFIGPLLILWAQKTSSKTRKLRYEAESVIDTFAHGPYAFTRSPTHYGIGIMFLGYSFIVGSVWLVLTTLLAFAVAKVFFLKKEEKILVEKYGEGYRDYKKKVKF